MARLELVAGDFGRGTAKYDTGEFRLPGRRLQNIANVIAVEANATIIEKHWGRALGDGVRNAAGLAPVAMLVGVFAAPLAAVATIGVAAAAVGGAVGLLGGGAQNKLLVQVTFAQGTGFIAVCDTEVAKTITDDVRLVRAQVERARKQQEPQRRFWPFAGTGTAPVTEITDLAARSAALPAAPPLEALTSPPPTSDSSEPGFFDGVTAAAQNAVDQTGQALSEVLSFVKRATQSDGK
jgi:hypothetical protein